MPWDTLIKMDNYSAGEEWAMRIAVLIKQVPGDMNVSMRADFTLNRSGAKTITNPADQSALALAAAWKKQVGGDMICLTMGPTTAVNCLREAAMGGGDELYHICDTALAGADTYITAKALAQAIKVIGDIDLILCGRHTVDGETGQTGPELAAMLGYVCVGQVVALTGMEEGELICQCMGQEGIQVISVRLPAVLCVCECQRPVYLPSIAAMRRAASLPVKTLSTAALGMDGICAQHDSPTQVVRLRHKEHVRRDIHFLTQKDSMIQTILSLIAGSEEVNRD